MTDTVLVTGATGFLAGHCIEELLIHGYPVRGTVRDLATAPVAHLRAIAERTGGSLDLVAARLDADAGWAEAVDGCAYVWHVASPAPARIPKDENELIRPAVDGTRRVLRAAQASGTVRRVVLTSSTDAVIHGPDLASGRVRTEADWSTMECSGPYPRSKLLAEQAAWEFVRDRPLELVAVNPGLILGPVQRAGANVSVEVVRQLLARAVPAVPRLGFAVVDVRDVAALHRLAMRAPAAAGQRYIAAGELVWMGDMARVLADRFGPRGYRVPTRPLPYWLMWVIARFDPTVRLALSYVGVAPRVSADKAYQELGWTARPAEESIVDTAESLLRFGVVPPSRSLPVGRSAAGHR